jgi:hypothetical protein
MPKLFDTPIGAADIEEYLRDHDDFSLELELFQHALQLGIAAEHGGTYVDPVTGKPRQFDLRLRVEAGQCQFLLAVECKNIGRNNPLLISRIPRERDEAFHHVLQSHANQPSGIVPGIVRDHAEIVKISNRSSLYPADRPVGKATAQVGRALNGDLTSADSESYDKWNQALSSAHELIDRALHGYEPTNTAERMSVVIPVLVLGDKTLWTVDYTATGSLVGQPVLAEESELYVNREYSVGANTRYRISHLHIYTRTRFRSFLDELANSDKYFLNAFPHRQVPQ